MADHCKLDLCYNCDDPYVCGHKCPHLFYLEVSDYVIEEPDDDVPDDVVSATTAEPTAFDPETPMISLLVITGIHTEGTMLLRILVGYQEFIALLDLGSTHNFISSTVACRAGL